MPVEGMIGRVLRGNTRGYSCGTHSTNIYEMHNFGEYVKAPITNNETIQTIGLIYAIEIESDQLVDELVMAEYVNDNILRDQRENRMVPIEIRVLHVGYLEEGRFIHSLPPRPPMSLSEVFPCTTEEVFHFSQSLDFLRIVINAAEVPSDDLIAACILKASYTYSAQDRYAFLVAAGRHLARFLGGDLRRLANILTLIKPV